MKPIASKSHIIQLIEVINEEIRVFHSLLDLLRQEQEAIVNEDVQGIEAVAAAKVEATHAAHGLESDRLALLHQLSESLNMAPGDVNLARLIEAVESHHGEELTRMREVLLDLNQKIRTTNQNNAFLIRQSLRCTERCLDILTGHPRNRGVYGKFGKARTRNGAARSTLNHTA